MAMASAEFSVTILTPGSKLLDTKATEVILPGFDGEVGILAGHQNFIGLLGTGALKLVTSGNDYWFMVSSGVFEVRNGALTVLAEVGEKPELIDTKRAEETCAKLEPLLVEKSAYSDDYAQIATEYQKAKARLEIHRRTEVVN